MDSSRTSLKIDVERIGNGPIIHRGMDQAMNEDADYVNINGPSAIKVPQWIPNKLGRYYLYFAHHKGSYIRLAFANNVTGPWTIHPPGALHLKDSGFPVDQFLPSSAEVSTNTSAGEFNSLLSDYSKVSTRLTEPHIASPDVVVDNDNKQLVMVYHGWEGHPIPSAQVSRVAVSEDGLNWRCVTKDPVGYPYVRTIAAPGYSPGYLHLSMPGLFMSSKSALPPYNHREMVESGGVWSWGAPVNSNLYFFNKDMRHSALFIKEDRLVVLWSRVGDVPERIIFTEILLHKDWNKWQVVGEGEVLQPELEWEGVNFNKTPSVRGEVTERVHQVRDPCILVDDDGTVYMFYTGAGEHCIGLAKLTIQ